MSRLAHDHKILSNLGDDQLTRNCYHTLKTIMPDLIPNLNYFATVLIIGVFLLWLLFRRLGL